MRSVRNAVTDPCARPVYWGCGFLNSYINSDESVVLLFLPSTHPTHNSHPSTTIPTFDIMSSFNDARPSLYVSTTPVDQAGEVPIAWNQMRANVRLMMLEASGVFQQLSLIV